MTVKELIESLQQFDGDMEVRIGMKQIYGSDFAMDISREIEELTINDYDDGRYQAVVLTEGGQIGTVCYGGDEYEYDDDYDEYDEDEEE